MIVLMINQTVKNTEGQSRETRNIGTQDEEEQLD